ncbi:MAG: hypothetical protein LBO62_00020, partial [Endomicrobium sp.]|nr:hypothetical protein [Endomicrobium sp.]
SLKQVQGDAFAKVIRVAFASVVGGDLRRLAASFCRCLLSVMLNLFQHLLFFQSRCLYRRCNFISEFGVKRPKTDPERDSERDPETSSG